MDNHSALQLQCLEMTTKKRIIGRLVPCRCFRGEEEVISVLDYSHCSLQQVPKEIFSFERTLEELYLDANQIEELPKQLFSCQALRKLSIPDNDLSNLPTTIASLVNLKELDVSKNGIQEFPDNIKSCKCLTIVEASVNPITKLPDGFTHLMNLTQLFLNDAFLESLPVNFGKLSKLKILELRENHLKTLPKSVQKLSQLERLDLGSNEFSEWPEALEQIHNLKELWMDNNSLQMLPGTLGKLKQLTYLDLSKNRMETVDANICGCENLEDLLLSSNMLQQLPESIGLLKKLTTLKIDENQLNSLPNTIGSLSLLEEFDCSSNELQTIPPTIGYLHNLRMFTADENLLIDLPREIGSCRSVTVMSLRSNRLDFLPDEIGQMTKLRVLNLSDNRLRNLPYSFTKLKDLAALWLSDNQSKALIPLQSEAHPETKQRVLTNYMFPQQPRHDEDYQSDSDSFNPTLWEEERQKRVTVAFDFEEKKEEEDNSGKVKVEINLKRYPTPYPEDLKSMVKSVQNMVGKTSHPLNMEKGSLGVLAEQHSGHHWSAVTKEAASEVAFQLEATAKALRDASCYNLGSTGREDQVYQNAQNMEQALSHSSGMEMEMHKDKEELSECSEQDSPNDIRISDMRQTMVEPPMFKPNMVILAKDKKGSSDDSDAEKMYSINNSASSAVYSECLQGTTVSSNLMGNMTVQQTALKASEPIAHWTERIPQSIPPPIEAKPFMSQRITNTRPLSANFNTWNDASHYENTDFRSDDLQLETSNRSKPMLGPRSTSIQGRRPLLRQERIASTVQDIEHLTTFQSSETEAPQPPNPWQNWTRTPSPLEDRTAFPSKMNPTPENSPKPKRKEMELMEDRSRNIYSSGPKPIMDSHEHGKIGNQSNLFAHLQDAQSSLKVNSAMSKSTERLYPMMKDIKAKFKKSQSTDELDISSIKGYKVPLDSYSSSMENRISLDRPDITPSYEHINSMSRSQSAPMLDDDLDDCGDPLNVEEQKHIGPKKVFAFDQSFNPQGPMELGKPEIRGLPFPNMALQASQLGRTLSKDQVSPRPYRGYPQVEQSFSFSQPAVNKEPAGQQFPSQRSRPGCLRRADSLVSSSELAHFRRMVEAQEIQSYGRPPSKGTMETQSRPPIKVEPQFHRRNERYEEEYSPYQEPIVPPISYPTKSLTPRRPLSARSYSIESYGVSQARPVSARPTMAALMEKVPPSYGLSPCMEKSMDGENEWRTDYKMPLDWRQQLLKHIDAKRPDWQGSILENRQEEMSPSGPWAPYSLGRRDVPPESIVKKTTVHAHQNQPMSLAGTISATPPHQPKPISSTCPRPQSARCLTQAKVQRSTEGFKEEPLHHTVRAKPLYWNHIS